MNICNRHKKNQFRKDIGIILRNIDISEPRVQLLASILLFAATCERCGAVGIKHAFYSKSKRFCSLHCSKMAKDDDFDDFRDSKIPVSLNF